MSTVSKFTSYLWALIKIALIWVPIIICIRLILGTI
jgi:hypothetical protein